MDIWTHDGIWKYKDLVLLLGEMGISSLNCVGVTMN